MITFFNEGELDVQALATFGISAKECDSPIGRFGTGLKYAIATILRHGGKVTVCSGAIVLHLAVEFREFRGKSFGFVRAEPLSEPAYDLGFTTELGKDWEAWEAYRELWCNAVDEGGDVEERNACPAALLGKTKITVEWDDFDVVHRNRNLFIIDRDRQPIDKVGDVEIYEGSTKYIFHRGIRVRELNEPAAQTYNLLGHVDLTEDRTARYSFLVDAAVAEAIAGAKDTVLIETALVSAGYERGLEYDAADDVSDTFVRTTSRVAKENGATVNRHAMAVVSERMADTLTAKDIISNQEHRELFRTVADRLLQDHEINIGCYPIVYMPPGQDVVSRTARGKIFLSAESFTDERTILAHLIVGWGTLKREWSPAEQIAERFAAAIA